MNLVVAVFVHPTLSPNLVWPNRIMSHQSLAGHFLVASQYLRDPNFARSVVLMIHHSEEGAMGVVINRPADKTVRDVWEMIGFEACDRDELIFIGGPVPGPLVAVHTLEPFSEAEVLPGVHVATHRDALDVIVRRKGVPLRLYSGHAGWGGGQLEGELEAGGWLTTEATQDEIFADHETVWKSVIERIGLEIMAPGVDQDHLPSDPSMN
jgi:putative transcriptional regulator